MFLRVKNSTTACRKKKFKCLNFFFFYFFVVFFFFGGVQYRYEQNGLPSQAEQQSVFLFVFVCFLKKVLHWRIPGLFTGVLPGYLWIHQDPWWACCRCVPSEKEIQLKKKKSVAFQSPVVAFAVFSQRAPLRCSPSPRKGHPIPHASPAEACVRNIKQPSTPASQEKAEVANHKHKTVGVAFRRDLGSHYSRHRVF